MKERKKLLIIPPPKKIKLENGFLSIPKNPGIAGLNCFKEHFEEILCNEIGEFTRKKEIEAKIIFCSPENSPAELRAFALKDEGYVLTVDSSATKIYAQSEVGFLYGIMTLRQLIRQFGSRIPCMRIGDAPNLAHRGVQLSFAQGHTSYRHSFMQHLVPELARWKINALYLYLESYFDFPSLPHTAGPGAMTAEEAVDLDMLCKSYGITLIPELNLMGHSGEILSLQKYSHLKEHFPKDDPRTLDCSSLCPSSTEVKKLVDTMLQDVFKCFSSELIHVGGDEVAILGQCPKCSKAKKGKTNFEFYSEYFGRIRDLASKNGRKIGIWSDMILDNCNPPKTEVQQKALDSLKKGILIYDWHYCGGALDTLKFFVDQGFETIACSSSHLCHSSSMWPAQSENQKLLFASASLAKASGGITTAWSNFAGLHEEQLNYLFATGAASLWSGPGQKTFVPGLSMKNFEAAYSLQRYGFKTDKLMKYLHLLGDVGGSILKPLSPLNGSNLRKCLFHTDNVLTFWKEYSYILSGDGIMKYRTAVANARKLWGKIEKEGVKCNDIYLHFLEGPLLTHEHLIRRFEITEKLYTLYDEAANKQFDKPLEFSKLMGEAANVLLGHLNDFSAVKKYLVDARETLGLERSSILRIQATMKKIKDLANYLLHLGKSDRPLPEFIQLHNYFLSQPKTNWYGSREHDWAEEVGRFQRYTITNSPRIVGIPDIGREDGPHIAVSKFFVSSVMPFNESLDKLAFPIGEAKLKLTKQIFPSTICSVLNLFERGVNHIIYYVCRIRCPESMSLEVGLGYDGPIKVWLNGECTFLDTAGTNPVIPEQAKLRFKAKKEEGYEITIAMLSNMGRASGIIMNLFRTDVKYNPNNKSILPEMEP